jgi:hypothetical protein
MHDGGVAMPCSTLTASSMAASTSLTWTSGKHRHHQLLQNKRMVRLGLAQYHFCGICALDADMAEDIACVLADERLVSGVSFAGR